MATVQEGPVSEIDYERFWEGNPAKPVLEPAGRGRGARTGWWLLLVLAVQACLSLRLRNSAFQDEALYMTAGQDLAARFQDGGIALGDDPYVSFFSGSPYLYPLAVGPIDDRFGLMAARGVGLVLMLLATLCVYGMAKRLAGPWAGVGAAAVFAVAQPTQILGNFATFDAPVVFLLALTGLLVVLSGRRLWWLIPAVLPAVLMVAMKYASALYLAPLCVLVVLVASRSSVPRALMRGVVFAAVTAGLGFASIYYLDGLDAVKSTTTDRQHGTTPLETFAESTVRWAGPALALAVLGTIIFMTPLGRRMTGPGAGAVRRGLLGLLLTVTGLLAPLNQYRIATDVSLHKHIGYGLVFSAVMAGVLLVAIARIRFVGPVVVACLLGGAGFLGFTEATKIYDSWPDTSALGDTLKKVTPPNGKYLSEVPELPAYYTRDVAKPEQWSSPYFLSYKGDTSPKAYETALEDGYFDLILLLEPGLSGVHDFQSKDVQESGHYQQVAKFHEVGAGTSTTYEVWVKKAKPQAAPK